MRVLCLLLLGSFAAAQTLQISSDQKQDPMVILRAMRTATGWQPSVLPSAIAVSGRTRFESAEGTSNSDFTIRATANGKFAHTSTSSTGKASQLAVGEEGNKVVRDTKQRSLPPHAVAALASAYFPFFGALGRLDQKTLQAQHAGLESLNGRPAHKITLNYSVSDPGNTTEVLNSRFRAITVWVDAVSFLPVQVEYRHYATNNLGFYMLKPRQYSDFRKVGEILVPFRQEETNEGLRIAYELSTAELDPPLTSTDFKLPEGGR